MAGTQPKSFPLFLRPSLAAKDNEGALTRQIQEIVAAKGHLRNVTEASLQADITSDDAGVTREEDPGSAEEEDVGDERGAIEHLRKVKQEMVGVIGAAHNESMLAVDFVSLLLSKYSAQGKNSMSDGLKQVIPPGTLAYDQLPRSEPSQAEKTTNDLVAQGQRLKGLTAAADNLLNAANRLEKEVKKETQYWKEVVAITDAGWSVCKISRDSELLGVQVGFAEAGRLFKNRGFMVLNSREDGSLYLDSRAANRPKTVRVRIAQDGEIVGTARLPSDPNADKGIEDLIHGARDSLFDEEMFHQMNVEAQSLTSYGVRWRDSTIHIPFHSLSKSAEVLVDLIAHDDIDPGTGNETLQGTAQHLATSLKILLLHAYRQRLFHRSRPPPPLSDRSRSEPATNIIRPLLNHDIHHGAVRSIRGYLSTMKQAFSRAGLPFSPSLRTQPVPAMSPNQSLYSSSTRNASFANGLVDFLTRQCSSSVSVPLPSSTGEIKAELRTSLPSTEEDEANLGQQARWPAQTYSCEYTLFLPRAVVSMLGLTPSMKTTKPQTLERTFYSIPELCSYIDNILALDIAHNTIARMESAWITTEQVPEVLVPSTKSTGHEDGRSKTITRFGVSCGITGLTLRWSRDAKHSSGSMQWTHDSGDDALKIVIERVLDSS